MNEEQFDIPCMNPSAPEPGAPAAPPARPTGPGTEPGGPDYAKLLQYLQFYQNQMGSQEGKWGVEWVKCLWHEYCACDCTRDVSEYKAFLWPLIG